MDRSDSPIPPFYVWLVLLIGAFCLPAIAHAVSFPKAWRTYDKFDGFVGSWVFTAAQGEDAALWFGTDQGVVKYDGTWQAYGDPEGQDIGAVQALLVDAGGDVWAGTVQGLMLLTAEGWALLGPEQGLPGEPFLALAQSSDGALWAGGTAGLYTLQPEARIWQAVTNSPAAAVDHLAADELGQLWLSSHTDLYLFEEARWREIVVAESGQELARAITALEPDGTGGLWIGSDGQGMAHYQDGVFDWRHVNQGLPSEKVLALTRTSSGELWVATNGKGVGYFRDGASKTLTIADGLAADVVSSIFEDGDGILWFGTVAGISRYDHKTWSVWQGDEGSPGTRITDILLDASNHLWVTTSGEGLYWFDGENWRGAGAARDAELPAVNTSDEGVAPALSQIDASTSTWKLPTNYVETTFIDSSGALWVGTNGGGAAVLTEAGDTIRFTTVDGLAENIVPAIAETPDGVLWFGTYQRGISRWDGADWQTISESDGLVSNAIVTLYVDSSGRLWAGTDEGLGVLDGGEWHRYTTANGLPANRVTAIAEAADGSLWFGTWGGGVAHLQSGVWSTLGTDDGLLAPGVEAIWIDPNDQRLWFGTASGLSVYDGMTWQNFGVTSGLNIGRIYAISPGPDGGIFLGTAQGIVRYLPDQTAPHVEIISVNGVSPEGDLEQVSPDEELRLTFSGRDLLSEAGNLFYRYRLLGFEEAWHNSRSPQITYPPLPEGDYTFEVMARDTSMNYSPSVALPILVRREPVSVIVPIIGPVRIGYALAGVALITLLTTITVYAVWSTVTRQAMQRQAVERRFNPYVAGSPLRDENMFYGRQGLLSDIEAALYKNSIMIHGERRIGKTSLLYQIKRRLAENHDPNHNFIPVFVDLEGTPEEEFFHRLMEGVIEAIPVQLAEMPNRQDLHYFQDEGETPYSDRDFRRDLRDIIEFLNEHHRRIPRLVFLLDEADIMNTYDALTQQQLRRILQDTFAQNVGAVVAGVNINKVWDRVESPWYNMFLEIALDSLDREEAEKLMREPVQRFYDWEEDAIHYVYAQSQGKPHRIQQICLEAVNLMLDDKRRTITTADVQQAYERVLYAENH